jgi:hypothetical protein
MAGQQIDLHQITVKILSGQSLSSEGALGAYRLIGIAMPVAWDAASISFQVSIDDFATSLNLYDNQGNEISINAAAGAFIELDSFLGGMGFRGVNDIKLRSGTAALPINQTADRNITLVCRAGV